MWCSHHDPSFGSRENIHKRLTDIIYYTTS